MQPVACIFRTFIREEIEMKDKAFGQTCCERASQITLACALLEAATEKAVVDVVVGSNPCHALAPVEEGCPQPELLDFADTSNALAWWGARRIRRPIRED
jgi:hypothetical protein